MNHLFHLVTAGDDADVIAGSIMGDFVKGRLEGVVVGGVLVGLRLHRGIDSFADGNSLWRRSRERLDRSYGLYRGVLVDLFYDHFLALRWGEFQEEAYGDYLRRMRKVLEGLREVLPERLRELLPRMFEEWLPVYPEVAGIGEVLERMSRRLTRANPLAEGVRELERNYGGLEEDFRKFYPEVMSYANNMLISSLTPTLSQGERE